MLCVTFCPFLFFNYLAGEERAGRFALFVCLVSRDCCVALPHDASCLLWYFLIILIYYSVKLPRQQNNVIDQIWKVNANLN